MYLVGLFFLNTFSLELICEASNIYLKLYFRDIHMNSWLISKIMNNIESSVFLSSRIEIIFFRSLFFRSFMKMVVAITCVI